MHKIENHIKFWLTVIVIGGSILGYLRFIDGTLVRPVTDKIGTTINYQTVKSEYKAGETVTVISQGGCKLRSVPAIRNFLLEDHVLLPFVVEETNLPPGCIDDGKELRLVDLPNFIGSDNYSIQGSLCYQVNPLRQVCTKIETNTFKVIKK